MVDFYNTVSYAPEKYGDKTFAKEGVMTFSHLKFDAPVGRNIEI